MIPFDLNVLGSSRHAVLRCGPGPLAISGSDAIPGAPGTSLGEIA